MAHKKVRVAIIVIGNCASSLVQGVQFYQDTADNAHVPGIIGMIAAAKKWMRLSRENVMSDAHCVIYRTQYETRNLKSL
jgi:myo-inositol-1-phosphate synthase